MGELKVGMRLRFTEKYYDPRIRGLEGVVVESSWNDEASMLCHFEGWNGGHSNMGTLPSNSGYFVVNNIKEEGMEVV